MLLKLILNDGTSHELNVKALVEIDGNKFDGLLQADPMNHEDRLRCLERLVNNIADFLDEKFPSSSQEDNNPNPPERR